MSTGSWFKAHRKQIITHTLIVGAFVLFLLFGSEPIFNIGRQAVVQGESSLHQISLPAETNNIQYGINDLEATTNILEIEGWAFVEGQDSKNRELYIVLKSAHQTYVFDSQVVLKPQLTQRFKGLCVNIEYSGFTALIPAWKIANGEYTVGIYIRKGDVEALQYTDRTINI